MKSRRNICIHRLKTDIQVNVYIGNLPVCQFSVRVCIFSVCIYWKYVVEAELSKLKNVEDEIIIYRPVLEYASTVWDTHLVQHTVPRTNLEKSCQIHDEQLQDEDFGLLICMQEIWDGTLCKTDG